MEVSQTKYLKCIKCVGLGFDNLTAHLVGRISYLLAKNMKELSR